MFVKDVMTKVQNSLVPEQSLDEAWNLIRQLEVDGLPVINQKGGIITLVTKDELFGFKPVVFGDFLKVDQIMNKDFLTLTEDTPLVEAWSLPQKIFPVIDEEGRFVGILSKEKAGSALFGMATRMFAEIETLLDSAHNGIIAINTEGIITLFNKAAEEITRRKKSYALGKHLSEVIIPQELLEALKEDHFQPQCKIYVDYSKGKHIYLTNRSRVVENGKLVGAVGVFQDISEIEFISEELQSVKELYKELECIVESSYDGILVTKPDGEIIRANHAHERITGFPGENIIGKNFKNLVDANVYSSSIVEAVKKKGQPVNLVVNKDKNQLLITGNPIMNQDSELTHVVVNIRDLTELNDLRSQLEQSQRLSEKYYDELKQLRMRLLSQEGIILTSPKMQDLLAMALRLAQVDSTVLITGESGAGKEIIAKTIHKHSKRAKEPFVVVNCGAIPENLLESELFGYERGAFTGANREGKVGLIEMASNGTLFLDEISELPLPFQVKLLRVIEVKEIMPVGGKKHRSVNVRILAATNRKLEDLVQKGLFREDLFFRLNVIPLYVWPLRERKQEIIPMVYAFRDKFCKAYNIKKDFAPEVFEVFLEYNWPGNVRELENLVERLIVTSPGALVSLPDLPDYLFEHNDSSPGVLVKGVLPIKTALFELEKQLIKNALQEFGSTYKAAKALKIDQSTLVRKMNRLKRNDYSI
ncbi:MAG TPA: Fis family transcriptional regulator [Desulfotomaculum sp.]|nr:MAG: PAS modulated sigma54 specific transcriptional regulator, Fis family [Desulfotomaculum sp. 46_80]HAG10708.1 Fis family transcriptional regulator [Desulfotomaculum sp.]HBY04947.1 Fis family transcriptional regulator [Desulfotomaculum sp.]